MFYYAPTISIAGKELPINNLLQFHRQRLEQMYQYEKVLNTCVFERGESEKPDKEVLSYERLLLQPTSYQVLVLIWAASPFPADKTWDGWITEQTVSSISRNIAPSLEDRKRTENYVTRVVAAAEHFRLVDRTKVAEKNMTLVKAAYRLHILMSEFAVACGVDPTGEDSDD